jgi:MFS family permease
VDVPPKDLPEGVTALGAGRWALPRPVWLLGWVSFFTDTATEMVYPLLPLFLTRTLGAGAMSLGIIEGVAEAANSVLKILSGRLTDKWGTPKPIVLVGYVLSSAMRPLIGLASSWTHVLTLRFADRLGKGIRGAPRDAMLATFASPEQRGRIYGFHRAMDHAGAVLGPLLATAFLYFYPENYRTLFALTIIPGIIVVILLLRLPNVRTTAPPQSVSARNSQLPTPNSQRRANAQRPTPNADLVRALSIILLFSLGNASDAFLLLRLTDLGIAAVWVPLLWSALHVVKVGSSVIGGELSDRFGRRAMIGLGWIVYALVYAGFGFFDTPALVIAVFLSYGLYFGFTEGVEKAWIADLADASERGTAFGYYNAVLGVGSLIASLLFGFIWTRVSPHAAFLTGSALALVASALLYTVASDDRRIRP